MAFVSKAIDALLMLTLKFDKKPRISVESCVPTITNMHYIQISKIVIVATHPTANHYVFLLSEISTNEKCVESFVTSIFLFGFLQNQLCTTTIR